MNVGRLPPLLARAAAAVKLRAADDARIEEITGLTRERWRDVARALPALGPDPAVRAARARLRLGSLVGRATAGADPFWNGAPGHAPVVFVTGHVGDLRALRYLLRRRVPAASVIQRSSERERIAREDAAIDAIWPRAFPHVFPSNPVRALDRALSQGSLIVAADVPAGKSSVPAALLGGTIGLDPRPFRLARIAGVPCRPAFLTAPRGALTVTVGDLLPSEEEAAIGVFARQLESVCSSAPYEIDGPTRWGQLPCS